MAKITRSADPLADSSELRSIARQHEQWIHRGWPANRRARASPKVPDCCDVPGRYQKPPTPKAISTCSPLSVKSAADSGQQAKAFALRGLGHGLRHESVEVRKPFLAGQVPELNRVQRPYEMNLLHHFIVGKFGSDIGPQGLDLRFGQRAKARHGS